MEFIESILNEGEKDLHTDYNVHFDYNLSVEMEFCIDIGDLKGFDMQVDLGNFFASSCYNRWIVVTSRSCTLAKIRKKRVD